VQSCAAARTAAQIRRQGSWLNPCRGIQASNWAAANAAAYVMPRRNSLWSSMCATAQSVGSSLLRRSESHLQWQEVLTGCCRARHATGRARPHRGMCSNVRSVLIAARVCGIGAAGIPTRSTSRGAVWTSPSTLATLFTSGFPANSRAWLFHREGCRLLVNRSRSPKPENLRNPVIFVLVGIHALFDMVCLTHKISDRPPAAREILQVGLHRRHVGLHRHHVGLDRREGILDRRHVGLDRREGFLTLRHVGLHRMQDGQGRIDRFPDGLGNGMPIGDRPRLFIFNIESKIYPGIFVQLGGLLLPPADRR